MADYSIRTLCLCLFCQVWIMCNIFFLRYLTHLSPCGSTICYLCLVVTLCPRGGLFVHTHYKASGQRQAWWKTHLFSKWCHQPFVAKSFSHICYIPEPFTLYHRVSEKTVQPQGPQVKTSQNYTVWTSGITTACSNPFRLLFPSWNLKFWQIIDGMGWVFDGLCC